MYTTVDNSSFRYHVSKQIPQPLLLTVKSCSPVPRNNCQCQSVHNPKKPFLIHLMTVQRTSWTLAAAIFPQNTKGLNLSLWPSVKPTMENATGAAIPLPIPLLNISARWFNLQGYDLGGWTNRSLLGRSCCSAAKWGLQCSPTYAAGSQVGLEISASGRMQGSRMPSLPCSANPQLAKSKLLCSVWE